ncbi:Hypothetical predicted protein [Mytilus galloprovincialis]|uniref:Reverse transcriptase domain-containing protein n=1 Tax=Mytilus galloprovincialis TaxID=29158 RepID=A0A8B6HA62_MYTGA|nr:Hypothetical predicted protein [Mytilus galloprovincialis]
MDQTIPEMNNVERSTPLQSKQDKKESEEINPQINNIEQNTLLETKQDKTPITTKHIGVTAPHVEQPIQNNAQRYMQPSSTVNNWNLANSLTGQPLVFRGYQKYSLQQPIDQAGAPFNHKQGISNQQMLNNTNHRENYTINNCSFFRQTRPPEAQHIAETHINSNNGKKHLTIASCKWYVPNLLKIGLLTPIFKNKGSKNDAENYRGITGLPVVSKIIDTVLNNRTQPSVKSVQHKYQRGFTSGAGPMNSALPVEEVYREAKYTCTYMRQRKDQHSCVNKWGLQK